MVSHPLTRASRALPWVLAPTVALGVGLSACTAPPTARSAFIAKADAICKSADDASAKLSPPGDPTSVSASALPAWNRFLVQVIPFGQNQIRQLEALTPPPGDEATIQGIWTKDGLLVADVQAMQRAAAAGDLAGFKAAFKKSQTDAQAANTANDSYGMKTCGSGG